MVLARLFFTLSLTAALGVLPASAQGTFQQQAARLAPADIRQAAAAATVQGPAPGTCACLADWIDHCKKSTKQRWYYLSYTLCLSYSNGNVIYGEGFLSWDGATQALQQVPVTGDTPYYNDSRDSSGHPFKYNNQQPKLRVRLRGNCVAEVTRAVTRSVPLLCNGGLLYGFLPAQGEGYLITLVKREMVIPS